MDIARPKKKKLLSPAMIAGLLAVAATGTLYLLYSLDYSTLRVDRETVLIGKVEYGDLDVTVAANGILLARDIELISSQVDGTTKRILARAGDVVSQGQTLVELDNPQMAANVEKSRFELEAAKAEQVSSRIDIENQILTQESTLMQSRFDLEKASMDLQAKQRLIATQIISQIEFQKAELQVKQLEQSVSIEEQRLQKRKQNQQSQLAALDAKVQHAQTNLQRALRDEANLKVSASMAGVVQDMGLAIGQTVRAGEKAGRIANQAVLYAQLNVPSLQSSDLVLGQRVELNTHNGTVEGSISRIDPAVSNGTVLVDVAITSALPASARPELAVEGTIYVAEIRNSLYVQRPSASRSNSEQSMFRFDTGQKYASRTSVKFGRASVNYVEVLAGLQQGDRIIISETGDWQNQNKLLLTN